MEAFTPVSAVTGGIMIGAAAALLLLLIGRVAGISGIVGGLIPPRRKDAAWRVAFLAGLVLAPAVYTFGGSRAPSVSIDAPFAVVLVGGLLVGFGSRLGAGCTSGHGVCGIGRGSPRSLAATGIFMATAILTVFLTRHVWGS
ncbi:YeeE/YedE family protein [Microvirga antarctica]|uniref:YeeE/YedE family protein n=1 Tax=Microvirga antarctica TaxID=2819233 RepID=UPI001B301805|nr:YeeE/YedE thiosulfate transporter family protein [Microvirga antarctica]